MVGDVEAAVAADGLAGAVFDAPAGQDALKPNPFRCSAMLHQGGWCRQRRRQPHVGLRLRQAVDRDWKFGAVQLQSIHEQLSLSSSERTPGVSAAVIVNSSALGGKHCFDLSGIGSYR